MLLKTRRTALALAGIAAALILFAATLQWWWPPVRAIIVDGGVQGLAQRIRSWGSFGVAGSIGLMIAHSFVPFPAEFLTVANGMVYGPWLGTLVSWSGAMLGASAAFATGRALGHAFVERVLRPADLDRIEHWSRGHGAPMLLVARLIPLVAFNLINYAAALARVPWWTFLWTTAVGILPLTILLCTTGSQMLAAPAWAWGAAALALLAIWYLLRIIRRRRQRH